MSSLLSSVLDVWCDSSQVVNIHKIVAAIVSRSAKRQRAIWDNATL